MAVLKPGVHGAERKETKKQTKRSKAQSRAMAALMGMEDPQEHAYDVRTESDDLINVLKTDNSWRFGSRDDLAKARAVFPHLPPKRDDSASPPNRPEDSRPTGLHEYGSHYSVALERQLELLRWLDTTGHRIFDDANNPGMAGFADAAKCLADCRESLAEGETYFLARHLIPAIESAAETMPDWTFADHMLGRTGFFWFERPLRLPKWDGDDAPLAAISWNHYVLNGVPARNFSFWIAVRGEIVPTALFTWASGELRSVVLHTKTQRFFASATGEGDHGESDSRDDMKLRYVSALVGFIDQRIFQSAIRSPNRAVRKRAALTFVHEPLVRVIELRRRSQTTAYRDGEHTEVDWSCQWVVSGHWRNHWYPKLGRHQPRWITPYVKGPEDKPLKQPRATIFAVVR